jgi:peptidoglycan/xylan/chitin deacetylase (PgdA/CDA1 family)
LLLGALVLGAAAGGLLAGLGSAGIAAGLAALAAGGGATLAPSPDGRRAWPGALAGGVLTLAVPATLGLVGATNPALAWLGPVTSHGPRDRARVALTFDDGPNGEMTLAVAAALQERGVQGTFFTVGKAVDQEPGIVARLLAAGHLVGNHSYAHDGWRFIQPGYPELERGDRAVRGAAGFCPRFFRPPHGTHTPFVTLAAHRAGVRVITWDVSAQDWQATDPADLTRRIVTAARPGSIILLHDGLDGAPGADRRVLLAALPGIIDGLRARGLDPVRLDTLLGERAERDCG